MDFICVPGHSGQWKDDECTIIWSSLDETIACNDVQTTLVAVANKLALMEITTI